MRFYLQHSAGQYAEDPLALEQIDAFDPTSYFSLLTNEKIIIGLRAIRGETTYDSVDATTLECDQKLAEQYPNLTAWLNRNK